MHGKWRFLGAVFALCSAAAVAQTPHVKIGLVLSLTGPAASLGIPARDTVALLPKDMGGRPVDYIVLDDASDTTQAVQTTKKLISEDHVDAIIGSSITPNSLAMIDVVAEGETPMISLASSAKIIEHGAAQTEFMKFGDSVKIEMFDGAGKSIFGAIDQVVTALGGAG